MCLPVLLGLSVTLDTVGHNGPLDNTGLLSMEQFRSYLTGGHFNVPLFQSVYATIW